MRSVSFVCILSSDNGLGNDSFETWIKQKGKSFRSNENQIKYCFEYEKKHSISISSAIPDLQVRQTWKGRAYIKVITGKNAAQWSVNVVKITRTCEVPLGRLSGVAIACFSHFRWTPRAELVRVPSDFVPAPGSVFYEVKRTSTKNTYRDKLRTDTFRFAHNIHDRNILFFFFVFSVACGVLLWQVYFIFRIPTYCTHIAFCTNICGYLYL